MSSIQIAVPGSKSLTQRYLVQSFWTSKFAANAEFPEGRAILIENALEADDPEILCTILKSLGAVINRTQTGVELIPPANPQAKNHAFYGGNAGTAVRFSAGLSLALPGEFSMDGSDRMRARPWTELIQALDSAGVSVVPLGERQDCPPAKFCGPARGRPLVKFEGAPSSQYASALLLSAPATAKGLELDFGADPVSKPYLNMTLQTMLQGGAELRAEATKVSVEPVPYQADHYTVEADASSAAFPLVGGVLRNVKVEVPHLKDETHSLQGDARIMKLIHQILEGASTVSLKDVPDLLPPLTILALHVPQKVTFEQIEHTRIKECDRPAVLAEGLRRVGAEVWQTNASLTVGERSKDVDVKNPTLLTEEDHRMAMAFGLLRIWYPDLTVDDPQCVGKSFKDYWQVMEPLLGVYP